MRVERFSLFFGPMFVKRRIGETEYGIGVIPLGGYVKITGMSSEETFETPEIEARAYINQPAWKRIVVIAAGPAVNLVLAFLLAWVFFMAPTQDVYNKQGQQIVNHDRWRDRARQRRRRRAAARRQDRLGGRRQGRRRDGSRSDRQAHLRRRRSRQRLSGHHGRDDRRAPRRSTGDAEAAAALEREPTRPCWSASGSRPSRWVLGVLPAARQSVTGLWNVGQGDGHGHPRDLQAEGARAAAQHRRRLQDTPRRRSPAAGRTASGSWR